jgi:hypothetical protein
MVQVEFDFTLPRGYIDARGSLHRHGTMRLATVRDELAVLHSPQARSHTDYIPILMLARVVVQLGDIKEIDQAIIEGLFTQDYQYLQELFIRLNASTQEVASTEIIETTCPRCGAALLLDPWDGHDQPAALSQP